MSTERARRGGWVDRKTQRACRWCHGAIPKGRYTFCSAKCVGEWRLRTDPAYLREQVFARDLGVCAVCGADTESLRKEFRKLDFRSRRDFLKQWKLREGWRRSLWDADHIVPVAEGGGECDLSNMRTLCLKCHRSATQDLLRRLSRRRHA